MSISSADAPSSSSSSSPSATGEIQLKVAHDSSGRLIDLITSDAADENKSEEVKENDDIIMNDIEKKDVDVLPDILVTSMPILLPIPLPLLHTAHTHEPSSDVTVMMASPASVAECASREEKDVIAEDEVMEVGNEDDEMPKYFRVLRLRGPPVAATATSPARTGTGFLLIVVVVVQLLISSHLISSLLFSPLAFPELTFSCTNNFSRYLNFRI